MLKKTLPLAVALLALVAAPAQAAPKPQKTIALPPGFMPEGIASGKGASFYVGSIPLGAVYRGSYRTGNGSVLVPPHPGRSHTGLKVDKRHHLLFVSGGESKGIYVYDSRTGADVASFSVPDAGFINDVVVTRRAAYFTDSNVKQLYRVRIKRNGSVGGLKRIPLTGAIDYGPDFNANGIDTLKGKLVIVQTNVGKLFRVTGKGRTREIKLNTPVTNGDGILVRGRTIYVVRNQNNQIAVVKVNKRLRRGRVRKTLTNPAFDVPTTIAPFGKFLYAVNARFGSVDDDDADIVRVKR